MDGWFLRLLLKDIPEKRIPVGDRKIPEEKSTTRDLSGMHSNSLSNAETPAGYPL